MVLSGCFAAGVGVALGDEGAGLAAWHKTQVFEVVDRQMREACPWQRTGGVVDHRMVDVFVRDAVSSRLKARRSCPKLVTAVESKMPRSRSTAIQSERTCRRAPLRTEQVSFQPATCSACFIRLRSRIAISLKSEPPTRSWAATAAEVPYDYGNRMVDQSSAGAARCPRLRSCWPGGLGKGLGAGDAERARGASFVTPAKSGAQGDGGDHCGPRFPLSRE